MAQTVQVDAAGSGTSAGATGTGKSQADINREQDRAIKIDRSPAQDIIDKYKPSPGAEADMKAAYREAGKGEISGKLDGSGNSVRDSKSGGLSTTVTVGESDRATWHTHPPGTGNLPSTSLNNVKGDPLLGDTVAARAVNKPFYVVGSMPIGPSSLRVTLSVYAPSDNRIYVIDAWSQIK